VRKISLPSPASNGLPRPSRHDSSEPSETEDPSPRLPPRPPAEQAKQFLSSANGSSLKSRLPPRVPSADAVNHIRGSLGGLSKHVPERELPVKLSLSNHDYGQKNQLVSGTPIRDSLGGLSQHVPERELPVKLSLSNHDHEQKNQLVPGTLIRDSLGGLSQHVPERELPVKLSLSNHDYGQKSQLVSGTPPPIPLASRPRLSELPAAMPASKQPHPTPSASAVCLKCRDFSVPDMHAANFPRQSLPSRDLAWLAKQLTSPFPSLTDKARALFTWLHYNIQYDVDSFFNNCVQPSTPQKTLDTGLAVCEGYAGLFATLATHVGLEAVVISGHGKGFGYQEVAAGSRIPPFESNHAWNAVKIDEGQWKLVDTCWGAGAVEGRGMPYLQRFDPSHFIMSNDEFGLRHFPTNKTQFYRDDGRPGISWEEYMRGIPSSPYDIEQPMVFSSAKDDNDIGERTFLPAAKKISIQQGGPIRFQFSLICEHWTLTRHGHRSGPYIFLLIVHGIDGRKDDYMPFTLERGSGPGGGGDFWYVVVEDPRTLGAPGQKVVIATVTSFGDYKDTRGLTLQEYRENVGRVGMGMSFIAEWELI
jgi:Transglutaminase-like superfamily